VKYASWNIYISLISSDFTYVWIMPNKIAKRNEVSQSMVLSACPMMFHRNVTIAAVTRVIANTATNSTTNFLLFIDLVPLFQFMRLP
jgi:hypothetical protein